MRAVVKKIINELEKNKKKILDETERESKINRKYLEEEFIDSIKALKLLESQKIFLLKDENVFVPKYKKKAILTHQRRRYATSKPRSKFTTSSAKRNLTLICKIQTSSV